MTRQVALGTALLMLVMVVFQSITGFLPTYFVDEKGLTEPTAGSLYGVFFAAAAVVQVGAGVVADRVGRNRTVALAAAASLPGLVVVVLADGLPGLVVGVVLLSVLLGCFPPAHAYAVDAVPAQIRGTGYGLVRTVYIGCGAVGPALTGVVAETVSFRVAMLALGAPVVCIVVVGWVLPDRG